MQVSYENCQVLIIENYKWKVVLKMDVEYYEISIIPEATSLKFQETTGIMWYIERSYCSVTWGEKNLWKDSGKHKNETIIWLWK